MADRQRDDTTACMIDFGTGSPIADANAEAIDSDELPDTDSVPWVRCQFSQSPRDFLLESRRQPDKLAFRARAVSSTA
jgi:hypothetical protein